MVVVVNGDQLQYCQGAQTPTDMRDGPSPTLSCSSPDEALFELLGLDKSSLNDSEDINEQPYACSVAVSRLTPPALCHRPHTPHDALLLVCPEALSSWQCQYIINKGYQATNDGGAHYGPKYVKEAALSTSETVVTLQNPNHHKVCVFTNEMISMWLEGAIRQHFDKHIQEWTVSDNNKKYIVNPRLRLLRYDAADHDVFLSHYDATTTTTFQGIEYESKLTILLYLNTEFDGGETAYLNSLNPSDFLNVTPAAGKVVVFNHELYHASRELVYSSVFEVDGVRGGTKFVLRSDVMFEKTVEQEDSCFTSVLALPTSDTGVLKVADVLSGTNKKGNLAHVLNELDFLNVSIRAFLVPGRSYLTSMLIDLGIEQDECDMFLQKCEASV